MARRVSKADMRYTDLQKAFLNMAGRYSAYEIFTDWIEVCALAVANSTCAIHHKIWTDREEKYKSIMNKYSHEEQMKFCEMLAWFVEDIEDNPRDGCMTSGATDTRRQRLPMRSDAAPRRYSDSFARS